MVSGLDKDGGLQLKIIDWGSSRLHAGMSVFGLKLKEHCVIVIIVLPSMADCGLLAWCNK